MNTEAIQKNFTSLKITFAIVLSIIILVVAQLLSFSISELPLNVGVPPAICNILSGVLYAVFAFIGAKLLCQRLLKISLNELRIPRLKMKPIWIISAFAMPALVLAIAMFLGGQ